MKTNLNKSKLKKTVKIQIAKIYSYYLKFTRYILNRFKLMDYVPNITTLLDDTINLTFSKRFQMDYPNNRNFLDYSSSDATDRFHYDQGVEEIKIYKLFSAQVFSELGMVKYNGKLFVDHIYHSEVLLEKKTLMAIYNHKTPLLLPKKKKYLESAVLISGRWPNNYYHWMLDVLTKFRHVQNIYPIKNIILANPKNNKFLSVINQFTMGLEVNLSSNNIQFMVKNLYVIKVLNLPVHSSLLSGDKINFLRQKFNIKKNYQFNNKYIYISRSGAEERKVENEVELMQYLSAYGFKEYQLEKMEINKQIELFENAKIIVAPHGAGLTNIIFCCKHRTSLIELFNSNYVNNCYSDICRYLNIHYNAYIDLYSDDTNIRVNIIEFKNQFQEIFKK